MAIRNKVWQEKKWDPGRYEFTMSPHVGHGRTQFNSQVSRDTTGNRFLIASSPTEGFFRAGFKSPKQAGSYTATPYYINISSKTSQSSHSLASEHLSWQAFPVRA